MALPTDGQLSFSMIAGQLEASAPYSLRSMSNTAGFSTPDSVSEFYGYGPGGSLTPFFVSDPTNASFKVCEMQPECCIPVWHNGTGVFPQPGDFVYTDSIGVVPLEGFKQDCYFGMDHNECNNAFNWFLIDESGSGQVLDAGNCFKMK